MIEKEELTAKEAATKLEVSRSVITQRCRDGLFPNAYKALDPHDKAYWLIPKDDLKNVVIKPGRPKKNP